MIRPSRRAVALLAGCLTVLPSASALAADPPKPAIFDPARAPEIVIHLGLRRIVLTPRAIAGATTLSARAIENKANSTSFSAVIASSVPGAAASSSGELHIRGSHGQYTYYLDGAPLPSGISGSFSDLIDPKNIETLRVYTGGFPARYGNNIAAIFDVSAKGGTTAKPSGFGQQIVQGDSTYNTTAQVGAKQGRLSWFTSGIHSDTHRRLDPVIQTPLHDAGEDNVAFGKLDYFAGKSDRVTLDMARTDTRLQFPNDEMAQTSGVDDSQRENGGFANLIWRENRGETNVTTSLYSHASRLRYFGSPADLVGATTDNPLTSTFENRTANYLGLRTDAVSRVAKRHAVGYGFDVNTVTGRENFRTQSSDGANTTTLTDTHNISGGDRGAWLQDDWTPGRFLVNYGARYDVHVAEQTTSQISPRLNLTYATSARDKFHAYYNRLFQPASVEDVRRLAQSSGENVSGIKPERNNFYEVGWQHDNGGITTSLSGYYKTAKDVIDEDTIGDTQIVVPFNSASGYVRGLEAAVGGSLTRDLSFYVNYARAWAYSHGPATGGLATVVPDSYFPADHDQRDTASIGMGYAHQGVFASFDGEYGSGFPFQPVENGPFVRVHPHFIFNGAVGTKIGGGQIALTVENILNHSYLIKSAGTLTTGEWGQGRTLGVKWTQNF